MNLLKNSVFLFCLFSLLACNHKIKNTAHNPEQINSIGTFPIKLAIPNASNHLKHFIVIDKNTQKTYSAQRWDESTLIFLADKGNTIKAGAFKIEAADKPYLEDLIKIEINEVTQDLIITNDKKQVLTYNVSEKLPEGVESYYKRSGFIHPLFSPNGKELTDGFPSGHSHQHGVFFAFVNNTYKGEKLDFWNQKPPTGIVSHKAINYLKSGPVFGQFESEQTHNSLKHGKILKEKWVVTIYNTKPYRIDIQTTLQSVAPDTLFMNKYHYGGMAYRGSKFWNSVDSVHFKKSPQFLTNEGKNIKTGNHSRPTWAALYGEVDGQQAGIAILGHPSNFRYPEPVRIHPSMPYFCVAPMVVDAFYLAPNGIFKATYTYISFDGSPPVEQLNDLVDYFKRMED